MIRYLTLLLTIIPVLCAHAESPCSRIVSLAPSVTETIFSLDMGQRLVGVTRYCRYPAEAREIRSVGGFYDVSVEMIVSLKPDVVVGLPEHESTLSSLRRLKVPVMTVDHSHIKGIKESLSALGERCDSRQAAARELAALVAKEEELSRKYKTENPLRTLVAVGRTHEGGAVSGLYVSGKDGFYSSVLRLIGMRNVNEESTVSLPTLSPEGLLALQPDAIVEIVGEDDPERALNMMSLWERYPRIPAVSKNRVIILSSDYAAIPGPRYIKLAEDIGRAVHGEASR